MNDNKIESTVNLSFHNLHTIRFPSRGGDITAVQKVNDVHGIKKKENQANNNNILESINDDISVLYLNDVKNNVKSSKNITKNVSISFADATKSKSVPVVPIDENIMGKTRKHRIRSHSAQRHVSLTNTLYSNYIHKTLTWLNLLGNGDTKPKLKKSRRKSKRDNAISNPLLQKKSHSPPPNKNKKYQVTETNDCKVKILYKNKHKPEKTSNTKTDKYTKKETKLKRHSTNYVEKDNKEFHIVNVSKECIVTDNRNEHKSLDIKTSTRQDRYEGNVTEHARKHSDQKKVKSNIKEFTSELKEYFGLEQIGNGVSFQENSLQPVNSENNLNQVKKKKTIKRRVRKSHRRNKKLQSHKSTPFENEKVVEYSHHETKTPSIHKCRIPRSTSIKKNNLRGNTSIFSIHGCKAISNSKFCESHSFLYSHQRYPNSKNDLQKCSRNTRNVKSCFNKNIPSLEYKPLIFPIDKGTDHQTEDKVVDYNHKIQHKDTSPKENCHCPRISYSSKGNKRKAWCNFLCLIEKGLSRRKTRCENEKYTNTPVYTSRINNKKHKKKYRSCKKVQRAHKCRKCSKNKDSSVIFKNVEDPTCDCKIQDPRYDPKIPIHRRLCRLLFDTNPPKCESPYYIFNRKPLFTDLFLFPVKKKRKSMWKVMKNIFMFTASALFWVPYWLCFQICRYFKCISF